MKAKNHIFKKISLLLLVWLSTFSLWAQNPDFTISGKVFLGGSGGKGVPTWNVNVLALQSPFQTFTTTTNTQGDYSLIIPDGAIIGPNKSWVVSTFDSCSRVLYKDTVLNMQGTIQSAIVDFELSQCQNSFCGIGFQFTQQNGAVTFFRSSFGNDTTRYFWDFGDGSNSTLKDPAPHSYNPGTYQVCAWVFSGFPGSFNFCVKFFCDSVVVVNNTICNALEADFSFTINNFSVDFDNNSLSAHPNDTEYSWDFGDNSIFSNDISPSHSYNSFGTFEVCLIAHDLVNGCIDTTCKLVLIADPQSCDAQFTAFPVANNRVEFDNNSVPNNPNSTTYFWSFGDGATSNDRSPDHTYANSGVYTVCLRIEDSINNCTDSICSVVTVGINPQGCDAQFTAFPVANNRVEFDNNSVPNNPNSTTYFWIFGDGATSNDRSPDHTYNNPGVYTVCLRIEDSINNCADSICSVVTVGINPQGCDAQFTAFPVANNRVEFDNNSVPNNPNSTTYFWIFGDGATSNDRSPDHTYANSGVYTVCLRIEDSINNCTDSICSVVTVGNNTVPNCEAAFLFSINGNTVTFNNQTTPSFNSQQFFWDFGDNQISNDKNPSHTYSNAGIYTVCLTVSDSARNCFDDICHTLTIGQNAQLRCISGKVFKGTPNFPAIGAKVYLIVFDSLNQTLTSVRFTTTGNNGAYEFCNVPQGKYLVKAGLSLNDPMYADFIPTYFGNALFWNFATEVVLGNQNVQQIDIWLIAGNNPGGPGFCGGNVSQGANKAPGDALENVQVMLLDMNDNPVQYILTNEQGNWSFSNVAFGTYQVYAEVVGKPTTPAIITLSPQNPEITGIQIFVETQQVITSVNENNVFDKTTFRIFPNPTHEWIEVAFTMLQNSDLQFHLTSIEGKQVFQQENQAYTSGTHRIKIQIENNAPGIYFLKVSSNKSTQVYRIVKL